MEDPNTWKIEFLDKTLIMKLSETTKSEEETINSWCIKIKFLFIKIRKDMEILIETTNPEEEKEDRQNNQEKDNVEADDKINSDSTISQLRDTKMLLVKDAAHKVISDEQEIRRPENLEEIDDVTDVEDDAEADTETDSEMETEIEDRK